MNFQDYFLLGLILLAYFVGRRVEFSRLLDSLASPVKEASTLEEFDHHFNKLQAFYFDYGFVKGYSILNRSKMRETIQNFESLRKLRFPEIITTDSSPQ